MGQFTNREKFKCCQREVEFRERVYPRFIEQGRMSAKTADLQTSMMREIMQEYWDKAEEDAKRERLI